MTPFGIGSYAETGSAGESIRVSRSAREFESLLIGNILQSIREEGSGWLGTGDDDASGTALGLGEQSLGRAMAAAGGLGLAKVIEQGLSQAAAKTSDRSSGLEGT